jgi:RNA polymerase sigma factor (TIGR02999 family)
MALGRGQKKSEIRARLWGAATMDVASNLPSDPKGTGGPVALGADFDQVYADLRALAARYLQHQRPEHTLQPTALVHEAYLRLVAHTGLSRMDRAHLFWTAARAMRSILVDHARRRATHKRQPGGHRVPLDDVLTTFEQRAGDLLALSELLDQLQAVDPVMAQLVDLRFFGGLTEEATAEALELSPRTVRRKWQVARAWLYSQMAEGESP